MAGDQSPQERHREEARGVNLGWAAVSYMIAGMAFWGFIGWLIDRWLHTGGVATGIGCVVGVSLGIYLVVKRLGA
jgi:ATP synthase protein I